MIKAVQLRFHQGEKSLLCLIEDENAPPNAYVAQSTNVVNISFHYKENFAIGTGWRLFPNSIFLGYHPNDIEHVSIYHKDGVPVLVHFSAHGSTQGTWVPFESCETLDDGETLIIYIARSSHANYPHKGVYWRAFGTANDVCSDKGKRLTINIDSMVPSFDHIFDNGVRLYRGLRPFPPVKLLTPMQKFLIPFSL